jgi:hypothetical protein
MQWAVEGPVGAELGFSVARTTRFCMLCVFCEPMSMNGPIAGEVAE